MKKHIAFFHRNFPIQFGPVIDFLLRHYDVEISFFSQFINKPVPAAVKHYLYQPVTTGHEEKPYFYSSHFEKECATMHGIHQAVSEAQLESLDLIIGHAVFATLGLLFEEFQHIPKINYFELFYNPTDYHTIRPEYPAPKSNLLRIPLRNAAQLVELEYCTKGYSPTDFQRLTYPQAYQHKLTTLFDGIDTQLYSPGTVSSNSLLKPTWPKDAKIVTYVARGLEAFRGFDVFMEMAHRVSQKRSDVHFVICGESKTHYGHEMLVIKEPTFKEHVLKKHAYDLNRFHFMDWIPEPALADLFKLTSCHFFWTVPLTLSWSFFQSLSSGVLLMGSNSAPVQDVLQHNVNGIMVDPYDIGAMVECVLEALDSPAKFQPLRDNARDHMRAHFSFEACVPKLAEYYLSTVQNQPTARPAEVSSQSALFNQAIQAQKEGNAEGAIQYYNQLLKSSVSVGIYTNLGVALRTTGKIDAAIAAYRQALALEPNQVSALSNLGGGLRAQGKHTEAIEVLNKALQQNPDFASAHYNLGLALMDFQRLDEAIQAFERAMELEPERVDAPFDRATCILQTGDLMKGFEAYESRFQYEKRLVRSYTQPYWDGSALEGRTLLLYMEQGFGDALQFCRYIPLISKNGGSIVLECPPELKPLMETIEGIDRIILPGEPCPSFDTHVSVMSLPNRFQTTLDTIPSRIPYLQAPQTEPSLQLRSSDKLKVGIAWASGHADIGSRNRSIELSHFLELLQLPHVELFSLQKGPAIEQIKDLEASCFIQDLSGHLTDFGKTADVLEQMDLLISADTAVVHLAGALGKPAWVLLPYSAEWRWMLNRTNSPWYPTLQLFRQKYPGDWTSVFQEVLEALRTTVYTYA